MSGTNSYNFMPAYGNAGAKVIQGARYYIYYRNGTTDGAATMILKIYNRNGDLQHTVSTVAVDLAGADLNSWQTMSITSTEADKTIGVGEWAAFHMNDTGSMEKLSGVNVFLELTVQ